MKASAKLTPQPSPAALSAPSIDKVVGTPGRIATLRRDCLIRDHHRCVISRAFDYNEAEGRFKKYEGDARDDDGQLLLSSEPEHVHLEVAHIIPHSIMSQTTIAGQLQLVSVYHFPPYSQRVRI